MACGKRVPVSQFEKALQGSIRLPLSVPTLDIWGRDIENSDMVFASGDGDGVCQPIRDKLLSAPWHGPNAGILPVWMFNEARGPNAVDPRQALVRITQRYTLKHLTSVVATELEFYLIPLSKEQTGSNTEGILSLQQLDAVAPLPDAIYATCAEQGIPADTAITECGPSLMN